MFVWMAKFSAAYRVRTGIHVGVDVLINRLSDAARHFIIFGLLAGALFTGIVATWAPFRLGRTVPTMRPELHRSRHRRHPRGPDHPDPSGRPGSSIAPSRWAPA